MRNLTPLTDEDIESDRKNGAHKRSQRIDDAFARSQVALIYVAAIIAICGLFLCAGIYICALINPQVFPESTISRIESIFTHLATGVGGYLLYLAKRSANIN